MEINSRIAGIDVHKKMLAVVVADSQPEGQLRFERGKFGAMESELRRLASWLKARQVGEVVMESTAQYWKPVWQQLEAQCQLYLAQAQSNRGPRGRKQDFRDAERLVRRHLAGEPILSFVPDREQRLWRIMSRTKYQLRRDRVQLHNQLEAFLEEGHIKLSSCVSDLLGTSSVRILRALSEGEANPAKLAAMTEPGLRATAEQLQDALQGAPRLSPAHRQILRLFLERLELLDRQIATLHIDLGQALRAYNDAVVRLAEVPGFPPQRRRPVAGDPGLGPDSAQQIIAEVGPEAASFPSPQELSSWVGTCPGKEESAEVSKSNRSPKGNRMMRRLLNQAAHAAVKTKGSIFARLYRRLVCRLGHNKAIWAVANRLCRLVWKILHQGVSYIEYGNRPDPKTALARAKRMIRELQALGYQVQPLPAPQPLSN
jgi:transposase